MSDSLPDPLRRGRENMSAAQAYPTGTRVQRLKTWPEHFAKLWDGTKTFEVRQNDRDFRIGDVLRLCEWSPISLNDTGRVVERTVSHMLCGPAFGIAAGYCVLSFASAPSVPQLLPNPLRRVVEQEVDRLQKSGSLYADSAAGPQLEREAEALEAALAAHDAQCAAWQREALVEIEAERQRQIALGWTEKHDDSHVGGDIVLGAVSKALCAIGRRDAETFWPWGTDGRKPFNGTPMALLTEAAAMIVAEIERRKRTLDVLAAATPEAL